MTACKTCHGYGTADGEPAGDLPRDTYDDPGPCPVCEGTGKAPGCARHGGLCDGSDRGCTASYPFEPLSNLVGAVFEPVF